MFKRFFFFSKPCLFLLYLFVQIREREREMIATTNREFDASLRKKARAHTNRLTHTYHTTHSINQLMLTNWFSRAENKHSLYTVIIKWVKNIIQNDQLQYRLAVENFKKKKNNNNTIYQWIYCKYAVVGLEYHWYANAPIEYNITIQIVSGWILISGTFTFLLISTIWQIAVN